MRADVCIVGGGYTGMWTAHFLNRADPALRVCIVESDYAGAGASGHNDGFATPTIGHGLAGVVRRFGHERAQVAYGAIGRSLLELGRFCRNQGVDADFHSCPIHFVASSRKQLWRLERDIELAQSLGAQTTLLDGEHARAQIGSPAIQGAMAQAGALINPHKLARGLVASCAIEVDAVHERRRSARSSAPPRRPCRRHTAGAGARATACVLATNAYQHRCRRVFKSRSCRCGAMRWSASRVPERWLDELPWPLGRGLRRGVQLHPLRAAHRARIGC